MYIPYAFYGAYCYRSRNDMNAQNNKKKVAIITDSSEGIGRAIAIAFAKSKEYLGIVTNSRKIERAQRIYLMR